MCKFFSFVTNPDVNSKKYYLDWNYRKVNLIVDNADSHSHICEIYKLTEDKCNKFEYNPLTRHFIIDKINASVDDTVKAEEWVNGVNFKKIVPALIIKPIVHPFKLPKAKLTENDKELLKQWASVRDSVLASVGASVRASVWASVWDSVRASVWDSVRDSVRAYSSSFFEIQYKYDFSPCAKLWDRGIVPSFDDTTWRLHSGSNADVIYGVKAVDL